MGHLQPELALSTCERALRQLITVVLSSRDGGGWVNQAFKSQQIERWRERRDEEARKRERRGHARVPSCELDYAEFYELREVLVKQWDRGFAAALHGVNRSEVEVLLKRFEDLRNTVAHSRELLPFEQDLLAGIAGDIRNRVTIYLSAQDAVGDYFPRVEWVTDSFGNSLQSPAAAVARLETGLVLRPGDVVTFRCRATDPQGRELIWFLRTQGERRTEEVSGADVDLRWTVRDDDVAEHRQVEVCMRSAGGIYHRQGPSGDDAYMVFAYQVLPPAPE